VRPHSLFAVHEAAGHAESFGALSLCAGGAACRRLFLMPSACCWRAVAMVTSFFVVIVPFLPFPAFVEVHVHTLYTVTLSLSVSHGLS